MVEWLANKLELARGAGSNVRPMEGMRGFAVFLVFLVHYAIGARPWFDRNPDFLQYIDLLHALGNVGVDLFFVLSGYLIYGTLISRRQPFPRFMYRRIRRIYPAFTVVLTLYVVLSFAMPAQNRIPDGALPAFVYLIENFLLLPGLFPIEPMITVAWSLSYEMLYYLVIPVLIMVFDMRNRSATWRTIFFCGLGLGGLILTGCYGGPARLAVFIFGILMYEILQKNDCAIGGSWVGFLALLAALFATFLPIFGAIGIATKVAAISFSFFVFCTACFLTPDGWLARVFAWTPMRWLGNMSYSYYLLHGLVLNAGFLALSNALPMHEYSPWLFAVFLAPMFFLTLGPSLVLFLVVERPLSLVQARPPAAGLTATSAALAKKSERSR